MHLILGDCLEKMKELADNSVDSIVTDPPYGLSFMGKDWDHGIPGAQFWQEALRVAKPGAHILAFGGTRTFHRLTCAIEDAGWEIRDCLMWVYGQGFPKSLDISKAIDKQAGAEREVVGTSTTMNQKKSKSLKSSNIHPEYGNNIPITAPSTDAAKEWEGWGTALKPAYEPIILARKPIEESTIAGNVLKHGTGGINIDGCRIEFQNESDKDSAKPQGKATAKSGNLAGKNQSKDGFLILGPMTEGEKTYWSNDMGWVDKNSATIFYDSSIANPLEATGRENVSGRAEFEIKQGAGRFPANFIHDGSEEIAGMFPNVKAGVAVRHNSGGNTFGGNAPKPPMDDIGYTDSGSAIRFFYAAKANKSDRNEGCKDLEKGNNHPTVKPTSLMQYLCRLITPPKGIILDPFMGSGSTGKAAILEGFDFIGIEKEAEYLKTANARIDFASNSIRGDRLI